MKVVKIQPFKWKTRQGSHKHRVNEAIREKTVSKKICDYAVTAATPMFPGKKHAIFLPYPIISTLSIQLTIERSVNFNECCLYVTWTVVLTFNSDLTYSLNPELIIWGINVTLDKNSLFFPSFYVFGLIYP